MAEVTVNLKFGEGEIEVSIEEAAELYEQLDEMFGVGLVCEECGCSLECDCDEDEELELEEPEICADCEDKAECPVYHTLVFGEPVDEDE